MKIEHVSIEQIRVNPKNPRKIKPGKLQSLIKSVSDFPAMLELRPIVVNNKGVILGGNMRYLAAKEAGLKKVPVIKAEKLTANQIKEFIIKDNLSFGDWDWDMLASEWDVEKLSDWGLSAVDFAEAPKEEVKDDTPEEVEGVKTDIQPGDLFEIGPHRLLCGDSTNEAEVARALDNQLADMVFTDPPYGVNVKGGRSKKNTISGDLTQTAIPFSFELCVKHTKDTARLYFCGGEGNIGLYFKLCDRYLAKMPKLLIWVKNGFVMKPNGYHNQYEIVYYMFKDGGGGKDHWYAGRTMDEASDVWQVKRDASNSYTHPTQKPIELPARAMRNSSKEGDLVFEPFSGSGSTMSAAHQLNRRCVAMELEPMYCQVTIDRMLKLDPDLVITKNGKPYKSPKNGE